MEPTSAVALSLALGAGTLAGKEVVSGVVKDAYAALKDLLKNRYSKVSVEGIEQAPASKDRRAVVEKDLTDAGAGQDVELLAASQKLTELVRQQAPTVAAAIGVDLKHVEAAYLHLADVISTGTGVKVEKGTFTDGIEIRGVRAGA